MTWDAPPKRKLCIKEYDVEIEITNNHDDEAKYIVVHSVYNTRTVSNRYLMTDIDPQSMYHCCVVAVDMNGEKGRINHLHIHMHDEQCMCISV